MMAAGLARTLFCLYLHCQNHGQGYLKLTGTLTGLTFFLCAYLLYVGRGPDCHVGQALKCDNIKKVVKQALLAPLKCTLDCTTDKFVSCNFDSDTHSSTFHARIDVVLNGHPFKLISWYNNKSIWL